MRNRHARALVAAALVCSGVSAETQPSPATVDAGQRIANERCARCHGFTGDGAADLLDLGESLGPNLAGAGSKYRIEWLRTWLATPTRLRAAGYLPHRATVVTPGGDKVDASKVPPHPAVAARDLEPLIAFLGSLVRAAMPYPSSHPGDISGRVHFTKVLPCAGCHRAAHAAGGVSGPELHSIAQRVTAEWLRAFVADPRPWAGPAMPISTLRAAQVGAISEYLLAEAATAPAPPAVDVYGVGAAPAPASERPARLYRQLCAPCHGVKGDGRGLNAPYLFVAPRNHTSAKEMAGLTDDRVFAAIKYGGAAVGKSAVMPSWSGRLSDGDVQSLVAYVRTLTTTTTASSAGS
ncbi:MAG: c-type cytochrome [Vicinamibacterales bacterium]